MALGKYAKIALIAGFLLTGSINTLTKKWQFNTCSEGIDTDVTSKGCPEGEKVFNKPWSQNIIMFIGESFVLFTLLCQRPARPAVAEAELTTSTKSPFYIFALPASCDVLGTGIGGIGMMYIDASVWQMMRGSLLIFTSILSVVFLKRKLYAYNWTAVLVCTCGLALVGTSAMLDGGKGSSNIFLGIGLTVFSQMFAASQMVTEELFVNSYNASPNKVVGSEGAWGILFMVVILTVMYFVPGNDAGSYENIVDSVHMIESSAPLVGFIMLYLVSIAFFNFFGVTIAGQLSSVTRTINDALRTAIVWMVQLVLFHVFGSTTYGAPWATHSWMQAIGFGFLISGSLINSAVIRLPCLFYPPPPQEAREVDIVNSSVNACGVSEGGKSLISGAEQK